MVPGFRRDDAWMPAPGFRWDKLRRHDELGHSLFDKEGNGGDLVVIF